MARTLLIAFLVSTVLGVFLGFGTAHSFLSVNAWQLESEMKSYETLAEAIRTRTTNPNAKALIEETIHNFGLKDVKSTGSHDFFVRNVGTADLILTLDRMTCSCTDIVITPTRVPPGRTATCHLQYNAEQAITGKFSQGGIIRTNDPDNREIYLSVEGIFTNSVVVQPTAPNFARVVGGTTRTLNVRFYGFEDEPLQLSAPIWGDREHFDFHWEPAELNESDNDGHYLSLAKSVVEGTITLKPGLPVGSFREPFQVGTNYPSQPNVIFTVNGQIVSGNVSISGQGYNRSTGVADLGKAGRGRSAARELSIQFTGLSAQSASVQVSAVEPAWLRTELAPPRGAGPLRIFPLTIEVPENAPAGGFLFGGDGPQAHVTLETNDETMPVLKIPLQFVVEIQ